MHFHHLFFLSLTSIVLGLDLLSNSTKFLNKLLWSVEASSILILPEWILLPKYLIALYCWKSYVYFFVIFSFNFLFPFYNFINFIFNIISSHVFWKIFFNWFYVFLFSPVFKIFKASTSFVPWSSIAFICFSNALLKGKYINLACSIFLLWADDNIFLSARYSYLSNFFDGNAYIFAFSLLMWNCSFSFLILSLIVMISFYILSKRLFLKRKELSDARVVSITSKEYGFVVHFS